MALGVGRYGARGGFSGCPRVPATVDVLSDEALVGARCRLDLAAGVMLSALWAGRAGQLVLVDSPFGC